MISIVVDKEREDKDAQPVLGDLIPLQEAAELSGLSRARGIVVKLEPALSRRYGDAYDEAGPGSELAVS